jgi:hypothetical protein
MLQRQSVLADAMMLPGDACRVHAVQYRCVPIQDGSDAVETQAPKEIETPLYFVISSGYKTK